MTWERRNETTQFRHFYEGRWRPLTSLLQNLDRGSFCADRRGAVKGGRSRRLDPGKRGGRHQPANCLRPNKEVGEIRVELATGILPHLVHDSLKRQRLSVWPIGGHGVERIGEHDDPCADRDILTGNAIGVPAAVEVLVVVANCVSHWAFKLRNRGYKLGASGRVRLKQSTLLWRQLPLFPEQWRIIFIDLPYIVQKRRRGDLFHLLA